MHGSACNPRRPLIFLATVLVFLVADIQAENSHPGFYNVLQFGAYHDGQTLATKEIQTAIDSCARAGGGVVYFPPGTFLSGTLYLKDHVHLHIAAGATLLGSTVLENYPLNQCEFVSYSDNYVARALIWGEGLTDIGISGKGVIDGQGRKFLGFRPKPDEWKRAVASLPDTTRYVPQPRYMDRPYLIRFISCSNIKIKDVSLRNAPMWMQHYLDCDFVTIENINVYNHGNENNDMIDIDCCRNVIIHGCFGDTDDDGITLKSTAPTPTENVVISDCIVSSFCNAIKMGTESLGGFRNITISNCIIRPSSEPEQLYGKRQGLAGIALEIVDGGHLDGVTISNISITGTTAPIFIRLGDRGRVPRPGAIRPNPGVLRNISIQNIVATGAGNTGCAIVGVPGSFIENVSLANIRFNFVGGVDSTEFTAIVPEKGDKYPESTMFGILPSFGFYCRHVKGLTFRDMKLSWEYPDHRPAILCDDVQQLDMNAVNTKSDSSSASIVFRNVKDAILSGCNPGAQKTFLILEKNCNQVSVLANDFSQVNSPIVIMDSSSVQAVIAEYNRMMEP